MTANVNVTKVLFKRGNTAQNAAYTGINGEITVDTQAKTLRIHDGVTTGGNVIVAGGVVGSYSNTNTAAYLASQSITSANIGAFQTFANANAATQTTEINSLRANITAANTAITNLTSNAAIQATLLDTLTGNAATQSQVLDTLTSNAAAQATSLTTLLGNAVAQQTSLIDLVANAAVQAQAIASVTGTYSNANVATYLSSFDGNILPSANVTYSLGSETRQWRDLWVSNNTIYIGNTPVRVDGGTLLVNGAPVGGSYSNANVATYLPTYTGNIAGNIVKNGRTWTFGTDGNLTVPASGTITAPNAQEFQLQASDTNSLLRNEINLDPNNGTYMSVWSEELETSFSTSDWATGLWENLEGVPGISGAFFTNAENLQDFWTTGSGSFVNSVEVSINGGARLPVSYDGNNGETYGALLLLTGVPATSPTTITSLTFYYRTQSSIEIDYDGGEILLDGQALNINLQTTNGLNIQSGQTLDIKNIGQQPVRIFTDDTTHVWEFDSGGSLTLPREGRITGIGDGVAAGDRYGYISWSGNSSGDGSGFNTMRLVPDLQGLEDLDQYIIIDPTGGVPGHIHIRAGGTQDNSLADLYLGGEHSHVKISAGPNPPVTVMANDHSWTFGTDGSTTFPDSTLFNGNTFTSPETNGILKNFKWEFSDLSSGADTVTLQWNLLDTTLPQWYLTTNSQGNIYVFDGDAKTIGFLDNSINSGTVTFGTAANNGSGGTNDIELTTVTGNAYVRTGSNSWKFDVDGGLTFPTTGNLYFDSSATSVIDGITSVILADPGYIRHANLTSEIILSENTFRLESNVGTGSSYIEGQQNDLFLMGNLTTVISAMGGSSTWEFTANGNINLATAGNNPDRGIVFGDGSFQSTAWRGFGNTIAIGYNTGTVSQGGGAVAVGSVAGNVSQGVGAVAVGEAAGRLSQGTEGIAVGKTAGEQSQGAYSIAIGSAAAYYQQRTGAVAIGTSAGALQQGNHAIAIGTGAGSALQGNNSIILNATGSALEQTTADTFTVAPIRNTGGTHGVLQYNNSTKEVSYSSTLVGNLTVTGNITQQSAYYETYANVTNSGGNLTCNFVNGATFYATLTANVTVNFANVVATAGQVTGATIIVDQGATAYSVANIQINGGGVQTVKWAGGTTNTGTASNTDVMSFSLISLDGTNWRVLGQIANYA